MSSQRTSQEPREGKKVALCGFAESYKSAPFNDPTIEVWGLNELHKYLPRWDRWFEVHDDQTLGVSKRDLSEGEMKRHLDWLSRDHGPNKPIYMLPQFCGSGRFPNAVPLPLEDLLACFKRGRYYTSTIAYMIAMAIMDGYSWIGMFGIDLASDTEYGNQRPCAEYYTGLAEGLGIEVVIAPDSAMCKAGHLYGFEQPLKANPMFDAVRAHLGNLRKKHEETLALANTLDGAMQECENILKFPGFTERGVTLKTY